MDNIKIDLDATIQELDNEASYKYPRIEEGHQILSQTNTQNSYQRIPASNKADTENIPFSKEQNKSQTNSQYQYSSIAVE